MRLARVLPGMVLAMALAAFSSAEQPAPALIQAQPPAGTRTGRWPAAIEARGGWSALYLQP